MILSLISRPCHKFVTFRKLDYVMSQVVTNKLPVSPFGYFITFYVIVSCQEILCLANSFIIFPIILYCVSLGKNAPPDAGHCIC